MQPTVTANCWVKTSLLVPNDCRCPVTTLVTRTRRDKPDGDGDGDVADNVPLGPGRGNCGPAFRVWALPHPGQLGGSPVLKQLFAWMFRDHAQDQAPGIRKLHSMPGRSPAEGTAAVFQVQLCNLKQTFCSFFKIDKTYIKGTNHTIPLNEFSQSK